jgi:MSHA biogenesis protein MshG
MPFYTYQALDENGTLVKGTIEFSDEHTLYRWLKDQGLTLVKIKKDYLHTVFKARIKPEELIEFSRQMYYIVRAGVPLLEGIGDLKENIKNTEFKKILETIIRQIQAGQSLADAFSQHPYIFPHYYTAIIRAGETSGALDKAFWELMTYLEWLQDTKNRIKQALIYPAIVSVLISIALAVFIIVVIPRLTKFLLELNLPLPWPTRMLIAFNKFIVKFWYIPFTLVITLFSFFFIARFYDRFLYLWDKIKLKLPYFGRLVLNLIMVRFVKYVGMLYRAGVQIYQTLDVVKDIVNNKFYTKKIDQIKHFLEEGETLSRAIELTGDFPYFLIRSVKIGETTGTLDETLAELGKYFEKALDRDVKKITLIIEPALLILVAIVILIIIISVLLPIYNMLGQIS